MRRALGWAVFAISALVLALAAWLLASFSPKPVLLAWLAVAFSFVASLLAFPPLWRSRDYAVARNLAALALAVGTLFIPVQTHAVLYLPPASHR